MATGTGTTSPSGVSVAVNAPVRQAELISRVVHGCKVGSADVVDTLIRQALPGLELVHVPHPPPAVPVKLDFLYFAVGRAGSAWDAVTRARNLAVWVPAELPSARGKRVTASDAGRSAIVRNSPICAP